MKRHIPEDAPIALIHGFATSFDRTWVETGWVDIIGDTERPVVRVDLLGHGGAPKPTDPEGFADFELHVLDQLPIGPVDAVGFSLGARTLLILAANHPDRFQRLVVAGVGANLFGHDPEHGAMIASAIRGEATENPEALHFAALASAPDVNRESLAALMQRPSPEPITEELLSRITHPTLVVLGDQDFAGPADRLVEALPNATFESLRGVDHFATPKNFGFIEAALDFLEAQAY